MASGTLTSYDDATKAVEQRWKVLKDIDAINTWVTSNVEKETVTNTVFSWDEEPLPVTSAVNKAVEAADYAYSDISNSKLTNYVQKIHRGEKVSYLNQGADHPAIKDREARTAMRLMSWVKNDLEYQIVNGAAAAGNNTTAAEAGGLKHYAQAAYTSTGGAAAIDLDGFTAIQKKNWDDGGELDTFLVNMKQKTAKFDKFNGGTGYERNIDAAGKRIVTGVDTIDTSVSQVAIKAHRYVADGEIIGFIKNVVRVGVFRDFFRDKEVARLGDYVPVVVVGYYTFIIGNRKGISKSTGYTG